MVLRILYQFHAFWRWFLVKVRCYSIDLINECLSLYCVFFFSDRRNEFYRVPDLCYLDKWSIWYRPCRIRSLWLLILNLTKMLSFIIMSYLVEIISCRIFIFKSFIKFKFCKCRKKDTGYFSLISVVYRPILSLSKDSVSKLMRLCCSNMFMNLQ